jgi:site-specific recombinase XerD
VRELTALRSFVGWASRKKYLTEPVEVLDPGRNVLGTPVLETERVELSASEVEALIAELPVRTRYGHHVRALFTAIWETSLRIGTMRRLSAPEHYCKGAEALRITEDIDKARYAPENPPHAPLAGTPRRSVPGQGPDLRRLRLPPCSPCRCEECRYRGGAA